MKYDQRAVFIDRDGVINEVLFHQEAGLLETPFTVKQFQLKKNVPEAIKRLNKMGLLVIVVSNQPGVAMKHFSLKTLSKMTQKMTTQLKRKGATIDGIYYCLHHPQKGIGRLKQVCKCRKPKSGMLLKASKDFKIDLKHSYMIGDSITDVQAGKDAQCKTFLLAHMKCDLCQLMEKKGIKPNYYAKDLLEAVRKIRSFEIN